MNKLWLKAAGIRALKTLAQTAAATIGTSAVLSEVNWTTVVSASIVAAVLSLLTSVAGLPEVDMAAEKEKEAEKTAEKEKTSDKAAEKTADQAADKAAGK